MANLQHVLKKLVCFLWIRTIYKWDVDNKAARILTTRLAIEKEGFMGKKFRHIKAM